MAELHEALACLRPKEFSDVPTENLKSYLAEILSNAEIIANSVPPPPNGTPYESSKRTRTSTQPAANAADLTISDVRRPPPGKAQEKLQKSWGKPLKLGAKEAATGTSVFKMAGHDRHGAWFARTGIHEGLGFAKWKRTMLREFPESLEVQGGPGAGNVRGLIAADQRLEDIDVEGVGQLEVYQLSARFPGPTAPREFITLLITSDTCLTDASKVGDAIPRHSMVVSIPVSHPDAPPRNGMVRGFYESIEMIREIPLADGDAETNPVEWIMVTRSDPGGGIPRFMVERSVPSSIVQDAARFLDWACAKPDSEDAEKETAIKGVALGAGQAPDEALRPSVVETNGVGGGSEESVMDRLRDTAHAHIPNAINPLRRTISGSSSSTSASSDSFASAEDFYTPSTLSQKDNPIDLAVFDDTTYGREMTRIEDKKRLLKKKLAQEQSKQDATLASESNKTAKEIEKAAERHHRERKRQEDRFEKEMRKLEERREKETKKLLAKQQKEQDKNQLLKAQRERDEVKQRVDILEEENKLLKERIGELQRENTALAVRLGKTDMGKDILKSVREYLSGRNRASSKSSSRTSRSSGKSEGGEGSEPTARRPHGRVLTT